MHSQENEWVVFDGVYEAVWFKGDTWTVPPKACPVGYFGSGSSAAAEPCPMQWLPSTGWNGDASDPVTTCTSAAHSDPGYWGVFPDSETCTQAALSYDTTDMGAFSCTSRSRDEACGRGCRAKTMPA